MISAHPDGRDFAVPVRPQRTAAESLWTFAFALRHDVAACRSLPIR